MPAVSLATCSALPDGDEDGELLLAALHDAGIAARWVPWTDPDADWAAGLVVLRSTWDYTPRRPEFLQWVASVPRLENPAAVVRWNTDKVYLHDLAATGVPTVPTTVAPPGSDVDGLALDGETVVKPSIGAGSRGVGRFAPGRAAEARAHVGHLHTAGRTALLQPYLEAVEHAGETSLVYIDGTFSHAVRKGPMLPAGTAHPVDSWELYVEEAIEPRAADAAELAVGEAALRAVRARFGADLLYTRVDLLPTADGPVVVELELTEPSLFLHHDPGAAARFAAAIAARA